MPIEFNNHESIKSDPSGPSLQFSQSHAPGAPPRMSELSLLPVLGALIPGIGLIVCVYLIQQNRQAAARGNLWPRTQTVAVVLSTVVSTLVFLIIVFLAWGYNVV